MKPVFTSPRDCHANTDGCLFSANFLFRSGGTGLPSGARVRPVGHLLSLQPNNARLSINFPKDIKRKACFGCTLPKRPLRHLTIFSP
jgi:hypothetical protein